MVSSRQICTGNAFVGKYIKTIGTSGAQIGFGRPHAARPDKLVGYAKYNPVAINYSDLDYVKKGEMDNGYVYVAIGDWPEDGTGDNNVPFLVDTSAKNFSTKQGQMSLPMERLFSRKQQRRWYDTF